MDYFIFHGRCNPPHVGHLAAFKMLDEAAKEAHGKAFISLTGTQDPESNPLTFEKKYKYVKAAVDSWGLDIKVLDRATFKIYDLMRDMSFDCQKDGGGVVHLFAGEDRIESYQKMADSMIKKYQGRGECLDVKVSVEQTMTRDSSMAYSATQMRNHVKEGDIDEFIKHCPFAKPTTDELKLCEDMFHDVAIGMGIEEEPNQVGPDPYKVTKEMAEKVAATTNQLSGEQNKLYYIGGCVRDLVMGKTPNDLDLVTTMYYKDYANLFNTNDIRFRGANIIVVPVIEGEGFETACLPKGMSLDDRIQHSDLTINSMVQDIVTGEIYDPLGGQEDIKNKIIRNTDFMIEAFGNGQQPVAVLRTIRFYSILDYQLDEDSLNALTAFSVATKGRLKVTNRQFEKDWHKVKKAGREEKFIEMMKSLGLHDYLVDTQPEYSKEKSAMREASAKPKGFGSLLKKLDYDFVNDNLTKVESFSLAEKISEIVSGIWPDYNFRASTKGTAKVPVIDCTLVDDPNSDNAPDFEENKYFEKAKVIDVSDSRAFSGYIVLMKNGKPVEPRKATKRTEAVYFVARYHQDGGRAQQSYLTKIQECIQGKAIELRASDPTALANEILRESKKGTSMTLAGEKIEFEGSSPETIKRYCEAAVKTSQAFFKEFNIKVRKFGVYHPGGDSKNPFNTLLSIGQKFTKGAKDAWNPMDILVTNLTSDQLASVLNLSKSINDINAIMKTLIQMSTDKEYKLSRRAGLTNEMLTILATFKNVLFFPLSLKLNLGKNPSEVIPVNVAIDKQKLLATEHTDVYKAGKGFIFKANISGGIYVFNIRSNGSGTVIEAANGVKQDSDNWFAEKDCDIYVSKKVHNTTSQLGKALQALNNFCPEFYKKEFNEIKKMTIDRRKTLGLSKISWDKSGEGLPTMLHLTWEAYKSDKDKATVEAAKMCNYLAYYILYNNWTTQEACTYILCAAMKKNYGKMNTFAPLFKIA